MILDTLQRIWNNIYLRILLIGGSAFLIFQLLRATQIAWISFLTAFLIAYLMEPFINRLERGKLVTRWLGVTLSVLFILVFFIVGVVLIGVIVAQLPELSGTLVPLLTSTLPDQLDIWQERLLANMPEPMMNLIGNDVPSVGSLIQDQRFAIRDWIGRQAGNLVSAVGFVFGGLGRGLIIITLAAFIMSGYKKMHEGFYQIFPERTRGFAKELMAKIDKTVGGYIRAKVLEAIIVGIVVWAILLIMNVPNALAIAFVAALLNPIPYIGPAVATIPATLSALTVSWQLALITFIIMGIIQGLDGNVLAPILLSQSISVNPVTVLVSVLAGGALLGFWGILLSIPFAAFMQLLYDDYYLKSNWYLGRKKLEETSESDEILQQEVDVPLVENL